MEFSEFMAARLKEARKKARISAEEAGKAVDRTDKTIYAWENTISEPSGKQLLTLCRLYGVDISYFFPPDESQEPKSRMSLLPNEQELVECYRNSNEHGRMRLLEEARYIADQYEAGTATVILGDDADFDEFREIVKMSEGINQKQIDDFLKLIDLAEKQSKQQ